MIAEKNLESLEKSSARLTVTVEGEAAKKEYETLLQKYAKTAQIKGFRRGKVPANVLEQKFGESIRSEAGLQLVEESLKEAFEEIDAKPLQFEPPELEGEIDLEIGKDFTFTVKYDVFPEIKLGSYVGVEVEKPSVSIGAEDLDRELQQIREQNAVVVDKADDESVADTDIVTIDYSETDESGEVVEGSEREGFSFTVGSGYNRYKIDDDLIGAKKDEVQVIEKTYDDEFEDEELKGRSVRLKVVVTQIKQRDLPDLDDELAQDVSEDFKTLDDLKKDIKKRLREAADARIKQRTIDAVLEKIVEATEMELPESMIRAELQSSWQNFLSRSGANETQMLEYLSNEDRSQEDLFEEWRPGAERSIRTRLVMNEIADKEKIESTDEELEESIGEQAQRSNMDVETARQNLEQANMLGYLRSQIADRKVFEFILEKAETTKGKRVKFLDLLQDNQ